MPSASTERMKNEVSWLRSLSIPADSPVGLRRRVDQLIADPAGRFHFASLVRCTVEQFDRKKGIWIGSGGGMLDKFVALPFGRQVATNCATAFLGRLPTQTRLIVMFGLGKNLKYVASARELFGLARPGQWHELNRVAYTDGVVTVVHVRSPSTPPPCAHLRS